MVAPQSICPHGSQYMSECDRLTQNLSSSTLLTISFSLSHTHHLKNTICNLWKQERSIFVLLSLVSLWNKWR